MKMLISALVATVALNAAASGAQAYPYYHHHHHFFHHHFFHHRHY